MSKILSRFRSLCYKLTEYKNMKDAIQIEKKDGVYRAKSRVPGWAAVCKRFEECIRDDKGTAMTEYLLITMALQPAVFFLFHPHNGLYKAVRDQYDLTTLFLMFPGP